MSKFRSKAAINERLFLLLEELGEAQQAIGKILRHGYDSYNPEVEYSSNQCNLEREIGDILAILEMMFVTEDIYRENVTYRCVEKLEKVGEYLHFAQPIKIALRNIKKIIK